MAVGTSGVSLIGLDAAAAVRLRLDIGLETDNHGNRLFDKTADPESCPVRTGHSPLVEP